MRKLIVFVFGFMWQQWTLAFTIGVPEHLHNTIYQEQIETAFTRLYQPLFANISFQYTPFSRLYMLADQGQIDAIAFMAPSEFDASLVKVSEPLGNIRLRVLCLDTDNCELTPRTRFSVVKGSAHATYFCERLRLQCMTVTAPTLAIKALKDGLVNMHIMQYSEDLDMPCPEKTGTVAREIQHTEVPIYHYLTQPYATERTKVATRIRELRNTRNKDAAPCRAPQMPPIDLMAVFSRG